VDTHRLWEVLYSNRIPITIKVGDFKDTLSEALERLQTVGLAFIDGNHTYEATKDYFEKIFPYVNENSCLIFHDIHWSKGMRKAWDEISKDNRVVFSIDLFEMGLVFFNKGVPKQHFQLKFLHLCGIFLGYM
jgi:predicted O-methyltransferase YrrM